MKDVLVSKASGAPDLDTLANAYIYLQVPPLLSASLVFLAYSPQYRLPPSCHTNEYAMAAAEQGCDIKC